ncbi:TRAFAC clade GTPase domain-containing protein [Nocardiopsis valliformis]|uniref:TRAFAC clade GTPase domain-containing protein n=1 Tax=Nocardiopsis valliformis TaxID=239974 RepID=UPI00034B78FF|nr:hypothetical protein [Nocardiopsis valliformis]
MEELAGWLIGGALIVALVVFVLWVVVALLVRILAWILVLWVLGLVAGLVAGIGTGVVLPARVLVGRAQGKPVIATPDAVVAGDVLGRVPNGPAKYFGWDHAWPVYHPYQARWDANAVLAEVERLSKDSFAWIMERWLLALAALPVFVGFAVGAWASVLAWYVVMWLLGLVIHLGQWVGVLGCRSFDYLTRWNRRAVLRCVKCYRITTVPSYRCANPDCATVHHDVRPGPQGVVHRRCGCGTSIPVAVGGAAKRLVTVCPFCLQDLPEGSGVRRVLLLPVIGAVSAGKTQFLSSGVVGLREWAETLSGALTPLTSVADEFLRSATTAVATDQKVEKTAWEDRPEGVPLILTLRGREVEIQIMDAAGENFVDWERSGSLGYIATADILLFVLDPLALPEVNERLRVAQEEVEVPIAQGDQADAYASVVDRLRAQGVRLRGKRLAIVLTKLDVLRRIPDTGAMDPADGGSVREWLKANGAHGLVRRIDRDFRDADYFAVGSRGIRDGTDPVHPVRVLDWALRKTNTRMTVLPEPETVLMGEDKGEG